MAGDTSEKNNLVVGEGVRILGEVHVPGVVRVFGIIEGKVSGKDILVGPSGRIQGSLMADNVDLQGYAGDSIMVRNRLSIRSTAHVVGTIDYQAIEIEAGARIEGSLRNSPSSAPVIRPGKPLLESPVSSGTVLSKPSAEAVAPGSGSTDLSGS